MWQTSHRKEEIGLNGPWAAEKLVLLLLAVKKTVRTGYSLNVKSIRQKQWEASFGDTTEIAPNFLLLEQNKKRVNVTWRTVPQLVTNHFWAFFKTNLSVKKSCSEWFPKGGSPGFCLPTYHKNRCHLSVLRSGRHTSTQCTVSRYHKQLLADSNRQ